MNELPAFTEVPTEQFLRFVLPHIIESNDVQWGVTDEVREDLSYTELADPQYVESIDIDEEGVIVYSEYQCTVTEKVARATRWQPAEYKNHDVTVHAVFEMAWPEDLYELGSEASILVEQEEYPTEPPVPDI